VQEFAHFGGRFKVQIYQKSHPNISNYCPCGYFTCAGGSNLFVDFLGTNDFRPKGHGFSFQQIGNCCFGEEGRYHPL
jgi:hypothetical protein